MGTSSNPVIGDQIEGCSSSTPEGIFYYNPEKMMSSFARCINITNLPLKLCQCKIYEKFVQKSLQPSYKRFSLNTLVQRMVSAYKKDKKVLQKYFLTFDGLVSLTTNIWNTEAGERFICVTCHWIDESWNKQSRVIGFRIIGDDATNVDVCGNIINVLKVFKLRSKVFCFSLGNGFGNDECGHMINELKPSFSELFVYDKSCAYVTNLCAQQGTKELQWLVKPFRELVRWSRISSRYYKHVFKLMCKAVGLKPRHFPLDLATSWNSTYDMLRLVYPYRDILTELYNNSVDERLDFRWDVVKSIIQLFEKFSNAIRTFSLVYDSSCHLAIRECIEIAHVLKTYENDPLLGLVVRNMKNKWLECMSDVPTVYCIATILDPRVKVEGLLRLLEYYYEMFGVTCCAKEKVSESKDILSRLYTYYGSIYKSTSKEVMQIDNSSFGSELIMHILKKARISGQGNTPEIDEYLFFEHIIPEHFDILQWWNNREGIFPILSKVAKDILCIPISIVALESAFSIGERERVLDEQWWTLDPDAMEACICKRDWDMAEEGVQRVHRQLDEDDPLMMMDTSDSETDEGGHV